MLIPSKDTLGRFHRLSLTEKGNEPGSTSDPEFLDIEKERITWGWQAYAIHILLILLYTIVAALFVTKYSNRPACQCSLAYCMSYKPV